MARSLTSVAASLVCALAGTAAAHAEATTVNDKRADVVLNGKAAGERTDAEKSFAHRLDAKRVRLNHGAKYISVRITFANLQDLTDGSVSRLSILLANSKTPEFQYALHSRISGGTRQPAVENLRDNTYTCGPDSSVGRQIRTRTVFGKDGYFYAQIPRMCLDSPSKIRARTTVQAYRPSTNDLYDEPISSTHYKNSAWSSFVQTA